MTTQTGGAMDANPVASNHDAFDALLDASSLGAPRVQAVRRLTPAAVRDLLASRRSLPAADAQAQPVPQPEQVAQDMRPPLPPVGAGREPRRAPAGSRSHHWVQAEIKINRGRGNVLLLHVDPHERIPRQLNFLIQGFAELAERILEIVFLDVFPDCPKEASKAAEAPMKTRLLKQLFFPEQGSGRIGRYGVGVKLTLASPIIREEMWRSGTLSAGLSGNVRSGYTGGNQRVHAGWLHGRGCNLCDEAWRLWDTGAAQ